MLKIQENKNVRIVFILVKSKLLCKDGKHVNSKLNREKSSVSFLPFFKVVIITDSQL